MTRGVFHDVDSPLSSSAVVRWDAWAVLETLKEITRALLELEKQRVVHGDLKPLNVMLSTGDADRRGFVAKVTDFGLSRVMRPGQEVIHTRSFGTVSHACWCKGLLVRQWRQVGVHGPR